MFPEEDEEVLTEEDEEVHAEEDEEVLAEEDIATRGKLRQMGRVGKRGKGEKMCMDQWNSPRGTTQ